MTPIVVSVGGLVAAAANNILTSSQPAAGSITMNGSLVTGGTAILDTPRRVLFTTNSTDSTNNFVVTGTNWSGLTISETVPFPASTTGYTVLDYKTVTSIVMAKTLSANITIGTNGVASSAWIRLDPWANPAVSGQCVVTGTANYTIQCSNDDPNSFSNPVTMANMTWDSSYAGLTGATASSQFGISIAPSWLRILLNSGSGSVAMTVAQYSVTPR